LQAFQAVLIYRLRVKARDENGIWDIGEPAKIDKIGWFRSNNLPAPLRSQFQKSYKVA